MIKNHLVTLVDTPEEKRRATEEAVGEVEVTINVTFFYDNVSLRAVVADEAGQFKWAGPSYELTAAVTSILSRKQSEIHDECDKLKRQIYVRGEEACIS